MPVALGISGGPDRRIDVPFGSHVWSLQAT